MISELIWQHQHVTVRNSDSSYSWTLQPQNVASPNRLFPSALQGRKRDQSMGFRSVQFSSVAQSCPTLWDPVDCSTPGFPVHHQLPEFTQTHVHRVGDAIQPSHPLSSPSPPSLKSFQASGSFQMSQLFASGAQSIGSFSFNIGPSNEHSGLISFRMDLLAVQGTLKSLQHHSSKGSILQHSVFFIVQLSHPYMTTGKAIALIRRIFVGKVMSLLFNMLSRLVITFLPRSKSLFISWLQSPSA